MKNLIQLLKTPYVNRLLRTDNDPSRIEWIKSEIKMEMCKHPPESMEYKLLVDFCTVDMEKMNLNM